MSTAKITGGCHCGHVTYRAEIDPASVRICHCSDCQKLTGTAFRSNVASVPGTTFALTGAAPKIYVKTCRRSGNKKRARRFAPNAARRSVFWSSPELKPEDVYRLTLGGIDQRAALPAPGQQIWCRSALSWSTLNGVARGPSAVKRVGKPIGRQRVHHGDTEVF